MNIVVEAISDQLKHLNNNKIQYVGSVCRYILDNGVRTISNFSKGTVARNVL